MKILKQGTVKKDTKTKTCYRCKSKLEYSEEDIRHDREGKYILCPCSQYLSV